MAMFDTYRPSRSLRCPVCEVALARWQGKDGPCKQRVFHQREPAAELPPTFWIASSDCAHAVTARGDCVDGVWQRTWLDVKAAAAQSLRPVRPSWWSYKLEVGDGAEVDWLTAQTLLRAADGYREDVIEGRYVIESHRAGDAWEMTVQPDDASQALVVIAAVAVD